mmetsp:Transcript_588/g.1619  ORF Transcript_588/g.1619 Transcript_588/m.1619 type:complete len:228 (+) Transcript_588:336-1019(+)
MTCIARNLPSTSRCGLERLGSMRSLKGGYGSKQMGKRVSGQSSGRSGRAHQRTREAPPAACLLPLSRLPITSFSTGLRSASASASSCRMSITECPPSRSWAGAPACPSSTFTGPSSSPAAACGAAPGASASWSFSGAAGAPCQTVVGLGAGSSQRDSASSRLPTHGSGPGCSSPGGGAGTWSYGAGGARPGGGATNSLAARPSSSPGGIGTNIGPLASRAPAAGAMC